jgi:tRNA 2-thiouridine synthesizing protein A
MNTTTFDRELDVRGLNCPLPILRAKKALGDLTAGQVLKVVATDPGSVKDFEAFCKQTGNELLSHSGGPEFTFFMKKREEKEKKGSDTFSSRPREPSVTGKGI